MGCETSYATGGETLEFSSLFGRCGAFVVDGKIFFRGYEENVGVEVSTLKTSFPPTHYLIVIAFSSTFEFGFFFRSIPSLLTPSIRNF